MAKVRTLAPRLKTVDTRTVKPPPKVADAHYQTAEHKAWAANVVRRSGFRCEDPKHDPAQPRTGIRLFADHIVELRDGGAALDPANGMARCGACHTTKTLEERARRLGAAV